MTTPLIILSLLLVPLLATRLLALVSGKELPSQSVGTYALAAAFIFFAVGHFVKTAGMVQMLPPFVPFRTPIVYATGILEAALAVGLIMPATRALAGKACIAVLICFFPANIYAALNQTGLGGHQWGPEYLLIRTPLQILLIFWAYWFAVRDEGNVSAEG
ncbi:Uncharacterized membrane protein [Kordiimonas lacus]|uniref:Uncharacterized membrane protein n=2 Tax=Kordiimonas lacus TaxID=637679 RepID=A0A1G6W955_9PROT|nr:Uncharacterized membrane protein [Kordiimonas lacus]